MTVKAFRNLFFKAKYMRLSVPYFLFYFWLPPNFSFFSTTPLPPLKNSLLLLVSKAYKDGAGGRVGLNFTIGQSGPRACQTGTSLATRSIACIAAQVTVRSKGLSRTIAHLGRRQGSEGYSPGEGPRNTTLRALCCHQRWASASASTFVTRGGALGETSWSALVCTPMAGMHLHHENQADLRLMQPPQEPTPPTQMPVWCSPTTVLTSESWLELRIMTAGLTPTTESGSVLWNKTQASDTWGEVSNLLCFPKKYCIFFLLPIPTLLVSIFKKYKIYMTYIIRTIINTKVVHVHYRKYMKE